MTPVPPGSMAFAAQSVIMAAEVVSTEVISKGDSICYF